MTIPKALINVAVPMRATIGRDYDSTGKHVAYWYQVPGSDWRVYRHTVRGMLFLLRQVRANKASAV